MTTNQLIYAFGFGKAEGDGSMADLLGGKGAGLAAMSTLGLPVPPGFTITTEQCTTYQNGNDHDREVQCRVLSKLVLAEYDKHVTPKFGYLPLLSVRSGARVSMPGMMDTILNVGLTSHNIDTWSTRLGKPAALDSYRRLIQMYAATVDGLPAHEFEELLTSAKAKAGVEDDSGLSIKQQYEVIIAMEELYFALTEKSFPNTVEEQLAGCIGAVFGSWMNERAIEYRNAHGFSHDWGTAVTVQSMVFGNLNDKSATGVLFTRNPNTGEPGLFGEFLINAQGEDVVAGVRTPLPIGGMAEWNPKVYDTLEHWAYFMEAEERDMQDMEFTIQDGNLFVLQTRKGKRSAAAAFRIAHDLASDDIITWAEAVKRVTGKQYAALKRPAIKHGYSVAPTFTGMPAAGSVVTGTVVTSAEDAKAFKGNCVLVTEETTPDDFGGMMAAVGILTRTGGATSHAAVVARGMDKTCVVGAGAMKIGQTIKAGDTVTLDGATGRVWVNIDVPVQAGGITPEAAAIAAVAKDAASDGSTLRITLTPDAWQMQLPAAGTVILDVFALTQTARPRGYLRELMDELTKRTKLSGLIDFCPEATGQHEDDTFFMDVLGIAETPATLTMDKKKVGEAVGFAKWTKGLLSRWIINAEPWLLDIAKKRGWKTGRVATVMADLMEGGTCDVSPTLAARMEAEGVTMESFVKLLKAAGLTLEPLPKGVDEDTLMFAVLGK